MINNDISVAVLFTCYNRKEKTIQCIKSLLNQKIMPYFDLYVCDDASTDGTSEAIKNLIPNAHIIKGTGSLFWSRGMNMAMKEAVSKGYRYYLMINDDVDFFSNMWSTMFSSRINDKGCGVVGCTLSPKTGKQSYGGRRFVRSWKGDYIGEMLSPKVGEIVNCELANWNCFLIDDYVIRKVGLIDNKFEHAMGDFDYSLKMVQKGIPIVLATQFVGYCENNSIFNTFRDAKLSRTDRLKKLFSPTGLPVRPWYYFTMKHYRSGKIRNFILPYVKYILCIILGFDIK